MRMRWGGVRALTHSIGVLAGVEFFRLFILASCVATAANTFSSSSKRHLSMSSGLRYCLPPLGVKM